MAGRRPRKLQFTRRDEPAPEPLPIVSYRAGLWWQIEELVGRPVPVEAQADIFQATGKYANRMRLHSIEMESSAVASVCAQVCKTLGEAHQGVKDATSRPVVGAHLKQLL